MTPNIHTPHVHVRMHAHTHTRASYVWSLFISSFTSQLKPGKPFLTTFSLCQRYCTSLHIVSLWHWQKCMGVVLLFACSFTHLWPFFPMAIVIKQGSFMSCWPEPILTKDNAQHITHSIFLSVFKKYDTRSSYITINYILLYIKYIQMNYFIIIYYVFPIKYLD